LTEVACRCGECDGRSGSDDHREAGGDYISVRNAGVHVRGEKPEDAVDLESFLYAAREGDEILGSGGGGESGKNGCV